MKAHQIIFLLVGVLGCLTLAAAGLLVMKGQIKIPSYLKSSDDVVIEEMVKWKEEFKQYVDLVHKTPGLYAVRGLFTGEYRENLPLVSGEGEEVGYVDLAMEIYILDSEGKLQIVYLPWITNDLKGNYFLGTFGQFDSKEKAFEAWNKSLKEWGKFKRGYPVSFIVTLNPELDISDEPRLNAGLFEYWNGREKEFEAFIASGKPGELILLPTNITIDPNQQVIPLPKGGK